MNASPTILLILILVLVIWYLHILYDNESEYIVSSIDNKKYLIRNLMPNEAKNIETANTLAIINQKVLSLIAAISGPKELFFIKHLRENFGDGNRVSEAAIDHSQTSYTINKQSIHLCLRSRDQHQKLYDINDLMYVVIHELAHMCNYTEKGEPIQGHGPEFKLKFRFLINEAIKIGIYQYHDYNNSPKYYCGMKITSNILD